MTLLSTRWSRAALGNRTPLLLLALLVGACGSNGDKGSKANSSSSGGAGGTKSNASSGAAAKGGAGSAGSAGNAGSAATFNCSVTAEVGEVVQVPAGEFSMGCNDAVDDDCSDDEKPLHTVSLSAFAIDRTEVTQAAYTACVMDGACAPPDCDWNCDDPEMPAGCVTWAQADAYCAWADKRLPTEAEWEKAARGEENLKYPWGNDEPDCAKANMSGCGGQLLPAGSLADGASPYGALDMAGNMVELVSDWYEAGYYASSPAEDPPGPAKGTRYGGRGGGFKSDAEFLRTSKRDWYDATDTAPALGFRCAR